jgi:hypothetical protein
MAGRTRCGWWRRRWRTAAGHWTVAFGTFTHGFVGGIKVLLLLAVLLTASTATDTGRPATRTHNPTSSSTTPANTRQPVSPFLPPPPAPNHSTSKILEHRRGTSPWTLSLSGCTFTGYWDGAPLVRTGSCTTQYETVLLNNTGITSLPADAFQGMSGTK